MANFNIHNISDILISFTRMKGKLKSTCGLNMLDIGLASLTLR